MLIDCDGCRMQATEACDDCLVTFLLDPVLGAEDPRPDMPAAATATGEPTAGPTARDHDRSPRRRTRTHLRAVPEGPIELDDDERRALELLAEFGLIPGLRHTAEPFVTSDAVTDPPTAPAAGRDEPRAERAAG